MSVHCMLNISSTVTAEQIEQTIYKLLNDKVFKLNNILNEILKKLISVIKNDFI